MRSEGRKPQTERAYLAAIRTFTRTVGDEKAETVTKSHIEEFLALRRGQVSPASLSIEFRALRVFFRWLSDEGETKGFVFDRIKQPRVPVVPPPVLTDEEILAVLAACKADRNRFDGTRDAAIVLTLLDCGMRLSEIANVLVEDVDLDSRTMLLRVTKGDRPRIVPIGFKATDALDRYMRMRGKHRQHYLPQLWIGQKGHMGHSGIGQMLRKRGREAGITGVRAHRFRHSWAHRAALLGMQTADMMAIAGWKSVEMTLRYGASGAQERAIAAHRRFSPLDNLR